MAAAALCGAACAGTDAENAEGAPGPAGDGPTGAPTARWRPCGQLQCATVAVPLDHGDPHGRTIDLVLVRVRASDPTGRVGSLFVNPGGPGASGVEMVDRRL